MDGDKENEVFLNTVPREHNDPEGPSNHLCWLWRWLTISYHLVMIVFYGWLIHRVYHLNIDNHHILDPESKIPNYGGRTKFLTYNNEFVQLMFFTIQLLADLIPMKTCLQRSSDILFTTTALPLATFVTIAFWVLYVIDRDYVYPETWDQVIPFYINDFQHTTPPFLVLGEIFLVHHHFPSNFCAAVIVIFGIDILYVSWVVHVFFVTEWWCYPFMKLMYDIMSQSPFAVAIFFTAIFTVISLVLYKCGQFISEMRYGTARMHVNICTCIYTITAVVAGIIIIMVLI